MSDKEHKMKTHTKIILGGLGALVVVGGIALAGGHVMASGWNHGGHGSHKMEMLKRFDANGDGKVTADEIETYKADVLSRHDADGNGSIALGEFEGIWMEHMRPRMVDRFQMMDEDGDGQITQAEMDARTSYMMSRMDHNGDGVIDREDMKRKPRFCDREDDDKYEDRDDD